MGQDEAELSAVLPGLLRLGHVRGHQSVDRLLFGDALQNQREVVTDPELVFQEEGASAAPDVASGHHGFPIG